MKLRGSHNWINFKSNGSADSDTGLGGLYSTYFDPTGWWVNAAVWGGGTSYSTSRQALLGRANASTNGWLISTYGEAGYDLHCGPLAYGPTYSCSTLMFTFPGSAKTAHSFL